MAGRRLVALMQTLWAPTLGAWALRPRPGAALRLDAHRSAIVRAWIVRVIQEQLSRGPMPRRFHRDCAGLVRFAVAEALRSHDDGWLCVNGLSAQGLPPDVDLTPAERGALDDWMCDDDARGPCTTADTLVRRTSRLVGRDLSAAEPGDLLFFGQRDDQHLMVWMGRSVAYHTGVQTPSDNGLRTVTLDQLLRWRDRRWRPEPGNPIFVGVFRLPFLSR